MDQFCCCIEHDLKDAIAKRVDEIRTLVRAQRRSGDRCAARLIGKGFRLKRASQPENSLVDYTPENNVDERGFVRVYEFLQDILRYMKNGGDIAYKSSVWTRRNFKA